MAAAVLAVVLGLGLGAPAAAVPASRRSDAAPQQDPSTSTTAPSSSTTVRRSGDPVSDTQDAEVMSIVIGLVIVALLLTICCVVFWRMTKPVPVAAVAPAGSRDTKRASKRARKRRSA